MPPPTTFKTLDKISRRDRLARFFDRATEGCLYGLILFLPVSISGIEIFSLLAIICYFLKKIFKPEFSHFKSTPHVFLFSFLFFCSLSLMNTFNLEKSLHALIFKWFKYVMIFLMAEDIFSTPRRVRTAITIFLVSAFVIGVDGLSQRLLGIEIFLGRPMGLIRHTFPGSPTRYYHGVTASFKHYNDFGTYLVCQLLLLTAFLVSGRPQKHFLTGLLYVGALVLSLCLWLTLSRGAWLAFVAGLILMLFLCRRKPVVWVLSGVFLIPAFVWPAFRERLLFFFISPYGASERAPVWNIAWRMIVEAPFLGKGLGTFMDICSLYSSGTIVKYAHNCYLQMWAETGIFSVISFAGFSGSMLFQGIMLYKKTSNALFLGLTCAIFAFLAHCFLDTGLYSIQLSVLFWLLSGLLAALISKKAFE